MISAGLTGGIGSGKSTVAAMFQHLGATTINSDEIGRSMMQPGTVVYDRIVSGFGPDVVDAGGKLDRVKLANIVFNDLDKLKHLNAIVHAPVLREIDRQIQQQRSRDPQAVVLVESAVLFEAGQHRRRCRKAETEMQRAIPGGQATKQFHQRIAPADAAGAGGLARPRSARP